MALQIIIGVTLIFKIMKNMKKKEARKLVNNWELNEPNKFKAWEWFSIGLKEAERRQLSTGIEIETIQFQDAVIEFEEHWKYQREEAIKELMRLSEEFGLYDIGEDFTRQSHPDSAEMRHIKSRNKDQ
jgi:hypothetical protein